jgi:hypothetical protein
MNVRVDCDPEESRSDQCSLSFEVQLTLEPSMVEAVQWKRARSVENRPVMIVDSLDKDSQAFRRGMRPGMEVKTMSVSGEVVSMDNLRDISVQDFKFFFHSVRHPIIFVMREDVQIGSERNIDRSDVGIIGAHAKRKEIERINELHGFWDFLQGPEGSWRILGGTRKFEIHARKGS